MIDGLGKALDGPTEEKRKMMMRKPKKKKKKEQGYALQGKEGHIDLHGGCELRK